MHVETRKRRSSIHPSALQSHKDTGGKNECLTKSTIRFTRWSDQKTRQVYSERFKESCLGEFHTSLGNSDWFASLTKLYCCVTPQGFVAIWPWF